MKYTKEEISLCKQVAEKHRKDISYGDWYISIDDKPYLWESSSPFNKEFVDTCEPQNQANKIIPLWTISDCLEFLREQLWKIEYWHDSFEIDWIEIGIICCIPDPDFVGKTIYKKGKTPLEALLKAVLVVLEEVSNG